MYIPEYTGSANWLIQQGDQRHNGDRGYVGRLAQLEEKGAVLY